MSDAQQPIGHVARLETRHFSFEADGTTPDDALAAMARGLARHGEQHQLPRDWAAAYADGVVVRPFLPGTALRDGEELSQAAFGAETTEQGADAPEGAK